MRIPVLTTAVAVAAAAAAAAPFVARAAAHPRQGGPCAEVTAGTFERFFCEHPRAPVQLRVEAVDFRVKDWGREYVVLEGRRAKSDVLVPYTAIREVRFKGSTIVIE
jgi:hypothetical protein